MIVPTALLACWASLATGAEPIQDPLLDLVALAEALQRNDGETADVLAARVGEGAGSLAGLRAAEGALRRGPAVAPSRPPEQLSEGDAEREATRLLKEGDPGSALEVLRASGPEDRWPPELGILAARADHLLGNEAEARARWLRLAGATDRRIAAEAGIAWARSAESAGDLEGALRRLASLRGDPHRGAEAAYLAGRLELQHGRTQEAISNLTFAASKRRQRFADEAQWWLAWVSFGQGRFDEAAAEWLALEKGWPRSPLLPQGLYWRARALDAIGKVQQADAVRDRLAAIAAGSYYAVLAGRGAARADLPNPNRCALDQVDFGDAFWDAYRRAALLQGMGLTGAARAELEKAALKPKGPAQAWAMVQLEGVVGETGRAYARLTRSAASCVPGGWPSPPLYPRIAPSEVGSAARAVGIDPFWVYSLMRRESRFDAAARSAAGAVGLLQMLPVTGARIASIAGVARPDLGVPAESIWFGAWYLRALSERFDGNFVLVAAGYDAGPTAVASWLSGDWRLDEFIEQVPFRETRAYVKEVVANLAAYSALYAPSDLKVDASSSLGREMPSGGVAF